MSSKVEIGRKKTIDAHFTRKRTADDAKLLDGARDDGLMDELMCPICQSLPVDPVTAEDGRVYERHAIHMWFEKNPGQECKSPYTGNLMGKKLVPACQIKNTIERLVSRRVLVGEAADEWQRVTEETKTYTSELKELIVKAETGDTWAMSRLGFTFRDGNMGAKEDKKKAAVWLRKASQKGDPSASQALGVLYARGDGVKLCKGRGILELVHAAMLGSEHGCVCIGNHLANGEGLSEKDFGAAVFWYKKSLQCNSKDTLERFREARDAFLKKYDKEPH